MQQFRYWAMSMLCRVLCLVGQISQPGTLKRNRTIQFWILFLAWCTIDLLLLGPAPDLQPIHGSPVALVALKTLIRSRLSIVPHILQKPKHTLMKDFHSLSTVGERSNSRKTSRDLPFRTEHLSLLNQSCL